MYGSTGVVKGSCRCMGVYRVGCKHSLRLSGRLDGPLT